MLVVAVILGAAKSDFKSAPRTVRLPSRQQHVAIEHHQQIGLCARSG
jgi:hypothetical protein